jgi:hypothetical protein
LWAHISDPERNSIPVIIQAERQRILVRYGSAPKASPSHSEFGSPGDSSTVAVDDNFKVHGCMLIWNGRGGTNHAGIQNLVQMKLPWRAEQKAIRQHPLYQWLWRHFVDWATTTAIKLQWPKYSMKMELTLDRAKPCNVVHFHMCVSDSARRHTILQMHKSKWRYGGVEPHVCPCGAKGHRVEKSLNTIHYYCQAPKIGSLFMATNYSKFKAFSVESSAIYSLWRLYKMTDESTVREIMFSRCRGHFSLLRDIEKNTAWRRQHMEAQEKTVDSRSISISSVQNLSRNYEMDAVVHRQDHRQDTVPILGIEWR